MERSGERGRDQHRDRRQAQAGAEEAVGDRLEVRSLNDPMMEHWRRDVFGEDPPWAPTLVEVEGGKARAWTGTRMGARLARRLGPAATWRVAKILGEMKKDRDAEHSPYSGLSRSQFLKGVGGAIVGMSVLSGRDPSPPRPRLRSIGFLNSRLPPLKSFPRRKLRRFGHVWRVADTCVACSRLAHWRTTPRRVAYAAGCSRQVEPALRARQRRPSKGSTTPSREEDGFSRWCIKKATR